jgi:hypothetical protein
MLKTIKKTDIKGCKKVSMAYKHTDKKGLFFTWFKKRYTIDPMKCTPVMDVAFFCMVLHPKGCVTNPFCKFKTCVMQHAAMPIHKGVFRF